MAEEMTQPAATAPEQRVTTRAQRWGVVTSASRDKTICVRCDYAVAHGKYGKMLKRTSKLHAHDEKNEAAVGDEVLIVECRPMSKTKHWRLVGITSKGAGGGAS